jgi:dihydrofolate reductase
MSMSNIVYIATSLDGCIAGPDGELDWLDYVPVPEGNDLGFSEFITSVDAVIMGRVTFETVVGFGMGWTYPIPGLILSSTMKSAPKEFASHVTFASGTPKEIAGIAKKMGYSNLYIDGGKTIQRFLNANLIDEMIISEIPILLGGGQRLFGDLDKRLDFELVGTKVMLNQILKKHYRRKRE